MGIQILPPRLQWKKLNSTCKGCQLLRYAIMVDQLATCAKLGVLESEGNDLAL